MTENIKLLYIDLFCGAGGTSTGVENATHNGEKWERSPNKRNLLAMPWR